MTARKIRVLCVDDHGFLVDGLKARFAMEPDLEFAGRLSSAEGLGAEVERLKPDIVLLDIEMPGPDPFEAAEEVRRRRPETRVVMFSAYIRDQYLSAAFRAGVWGYFAKSEDAMTIVDGIRKVDKGQFTLSPKVAERCQPTRALKRGERPAPELTESRLEQLTDREREVLRLIGRGMSRAEIARTIHRSPKTVDGHRERIMAKLDLHSGPELVRFAIREGVAEA
jgi:DNA-binding NarL/FixJ family response regulator